MKHRLVLDVEGATWGWPAGDTLDWELVAPGTFSGDAAGVEYALREAAGPLATSSPSTPNPDQARMDLALAALKRVGFTATPRHVAPRPVHARGVVYENPGGVRRVRRADYDVAVSWIAWEGWAGTVMVPCTPEQLDADAVAQLDTVKLTAALFGKTPATVARDVVHQRAHPPKVYRPNNGPED